MIGAYGRTGRTHSQARQPELASANTPTFFVPALTHSPGVVSAIVTVAAWFVVVRFSTA